MAQFKFKISDLIFVIVAALLLVPQTRTPIQVAVNRLKVTVWTPGVLDAEEQERIEPFQYLVENMKGRAQRVPVGEGNVTFLSYWATWCAPCIAELPAIQKLYLDYGHRVNFLLVTQEDTEVVQRFLSNRNYELPVYSAQMAAPELLRSSRIPTTYIITGNGKIITKETGAADWNSKKVRNLIDGLLTQG